MDFEEVCEWCGEEGHWEEDCPDADVAGDDPDYYDIQSFLGKLETFLEDELDEECRGSVFLSETGENEVAINILVGAPFSGSGLSADCKQINVIIAPTDRSFLGSTGVSIDDNEYGSVEAEQEEEIVEDKPKHRWFDAAMSIFRGD